ncbi:MAG: 2-isopropylmalate synthase [Deltaproteobacteria bacterium]|nr:2-isopropylmalate synthase [Deltaproteobacteria bacterium]
MADKVFIFDTTLRDWVQVPGAKLAKEQKVEIARQLAALNVDIIEAGFPASSPGDFDAVREVARVVKGPVITGLARAVRKDIDTLWEAVKVAKRPRIHTFLGTSDIHIQKKFRSDRDKILQWCVETVKYARSLCPDVEFSTEDAARTDFEFLCRSVEAIVKAGATTINVPDTVGYATPIEMADRIRRLKEKVPALDRAVISMHCHNDLGLATANTLAGILAGARQAEVTVNGIGERAGNAALEEVVLAIRTRKEVFANLYTGVNVKEISKTSKMVSALMGLPVQRNKAIVGAIRPEDVGVTAHTFTLTARSGRAALKHHISSFGHTLNDAQMDAVYNKFLELADKKKEVKVEELEILVQEELFKVPETYRLEHIQILSGTKATPMAALRVRCRNEVIEEASTGNGPIDAAYKCIERIVGHKFALINFGLNAVTSGEDAIGEATVRIRTNGTIFAGAASSTDIIEASVRAYLAAINRWVAAEEREKAARKGAKKPRGKAPAASL